MVAFFSSFFSRILKLSLNIKIKFKSFQPVTKLFIVLTEHFPKITSAIEPLKEEIDKVIEDDITQRLARDLLQSIERKYQADLEKSVDMVLMKIKLLLQNGTTHIQDRLVALQNELAVIKKSGQPAVSIFLLVDVTVEVLLEEIPRHKTGTQKINYLLLR